MDKDFSEKIDEMIQDLNVELSKVRKARLKPKTHVNFVTQELNSLIQRLSSKNPDDPVQSLGAALSRVGEIIEDSFDRVNTIEGNIVVAIQSYQRVKEAFIAHENEAAQSKVESSTAATSKKSRIRKTGERPEDKLASRKKETSETPQSDQKKSQKRTSKKRKTTKVKKE